MFVLIVTANIPTLRPLFRSILGLRSSNAGSYPLEYTSNKKKSAAMAGGAMCHSGGSRRDPDDFGDDEIRYKERGYETSNDGADNSSVERILGPTRDDAIVKTADFTVTYDDARRPGR